MEGGRTGGQFHRPSDQVHGAAAVSQLEGHHAEQVQGVRVAGVAVQDRLVSLGRLVQLPLAVVANGGGEVVGHVQLSGARRASKCPASPRTCLRGVLRRRATALR